ncbi:MAG TPA: amidohydrolase family protein [Stellaceae bacterium]|nr:amidohydrolase family protein [Stellaceae bacterium]
MTVIDVHAHLVPQSFPAPPPGVPEKGWPVMVPLPDGNARMMIDGAEFRVFEPAYWDIAGRIAYMDREGISMQVLSPLPELLGYWLDPATTAALADHTNRTIADAVASAPGRLAGLGMLPLQDMGRSLETLATARRLGLKGFLVASNVNGKSIADPSFDPLFAELARLDMPLLVHGYRPAGTERLLGSPLMAPIVGVPQDCAAAVASFIATDVLGRHPGLKLGFVHGGGSFGAVLDRFDHVWHAFPALQKTSPVSPRDYVRRFFFDTVTFSTAYLAYLVEAFGADTLMCGSDGPTPISQTGLARFVTASCGGVEGTAEKILWRNAARFLGLSIPAA